MTGYASQYTGGTTWSCGLTLSYEPETGVLTYQAPYYTYNAGDAGNGCYYWAHTTPYMDVYIIY